MSIANSAEPISAPTRGEGLLHVGCTPLGELDIQLTGNSLFGLTPQKDFAWGQTLRVHPGSTLTHNVRLPVDCGLETRHNLTDFESPFSQEHRLWSAMPPSGQSIEHQTSLTYSVLAARHGVQSLTFSDVSELPKLDQVANEITRRMLL